MSKCNPKTVIAIAEAEVGYKEKASNSQLDSKTANEGTANWNKYARDIDTKYPDFYNGKKNGYDWCDIFVDWCFIQAYGREDAQKLLCQPNNSCGAGCPYSYGYYKAKGQVGTAPKLGAQIFFGKSQSELQHTGLVVDFDDTSVYTVEGNTGAKVNEVKKKKYARNNSNIFGYGYPAFDDVDIEPVKPTPTPTPTPTPEPTPSGNTWQGGYPNLPSRGYFQKGDGYSTYTNMKDDIKLIQEYMNWALGISLAIDGEYGNLTANAVSQFQQKVNIDIDSRYGKDTRAAAKKFEKNNPPQKEVKASQPAQSYNASIAGTYKVNSTTGLNVRDGAGTGYKVLTAIPNGMKVENYGYYTDGWLYIAFEQNGIKYIGFASKEWLTIS